MEHIRQGSQGFGMTRFKKEMLELPISDETKKVVLSKITPSRYLNCRGHSDVEERAALVNGVPLDTASLAPFLCTQGHSWSRQHERLFPHLEQQLKAGKS